MRKVLTAFCGAGLLCLSAQANATIGYCNASISGMDDQLTPVFEFPDTGKYISIHDLFSDFVERQFGKEPWKATCNGFGTESEAAQMRATHVSNLAGQGKNAVMLDGFLDSLQEKPKRSAATKPKPAPTAAEATSSSEPAAPHKTKADYDAEFAAKQAAYEREIAEQQRKVEEFEQAKRDLAKRQSEQKAAAQQALSRHEDAMRQHDAEVAKYQAEVQAAAAAPVLADFDKQHNLGQASADTNANRCVTTPETQQNVSFKGNTSASVINGCGQPVDVRICLMTADGWNCGVTYGLASQAKWSWSSMNASGPVFMDAKVSGSSRPFASPQ